MLKTGEMLIMLILSLCLSIMFLIYECVHCVSYSIQREALKLRCAGQVSYCTIQNGKFGPIL